MLLRIKIQTGLFRTHKETPPVASEILCKECYRSIAADEKFCAHCHAVILRRYCPGCRKLVPDHILTCPYCGISAGEKQKRSILQYPMNVAAVFLVLFLVTLILIWPDQESPKSSQTAQSKIVTAPPSSTQAPANQPTKDIKRSVLQKPSEVDQTKNIEEGARLNLKGHSLIKQGRYQEAVSFLYRSIETFPEDTEIVDYVFAQYNLGHSLRKIGKSEEAIPYLQRCVAYDNRNQMFQRELQAARRDLDRKDNY